MEYSWQVNKELIKGDEVNENRAINESPREGAICRFTFASPSRL
jgi:hypothetical protein